MGRRYLLPLCIGLVAMVSVGYTQPGECVVLFWYDDGIPPPELPLADSCVVGTPLPDGTTIVVYWDADGDGPDETDPVAPPCNNPPDCPPGTFNYNAFPINGESMGIGPGFFAMDFALCYTGPMTFPWIYLRICLDDMKWESSVIDMNDPNAPLTWTCLQVPCPTCPTPPPVTNFSASGDRCDGVCLTWSYPDTVTGVDVFKLFRSGSLIAVVPVDSPHVYCDDDAPVGMSAYGIKARRICSQDTAYSIMTADLGQRFPMPPIATNVQASENRSGDVRISWSYGSNIGLSYWLVRQDGDSIGSVIGGGTPGARQFIYTNPPPEPRLYDVVGASNLCGHGTPSPTDFGQPLPPPGHFYWVYWNNGAGPMEAPLADACVNGTPLPDGTMVYIYWDNDSNGPDDDDPLPSLCAEPPDCLTGPAGTVNMTQFVLNGETRGLGAGYFAMEDFFLPLSVIPPRFYLRVCLPEHHWESQVYTLLSSPPTMPVWNCLTVTCNESCPPPPNPQNVLASDTSCGAVYLSWSYSDTITGLDQFLIFRNNQLLATITDTSARLFMDPDASLNEIWYGIMARQHCEDIGTSYSQTVSDPGRREVFPPIATGVHATDGYVGGVEITWNYTTNAGLESWIVRRNQDSVGTVEEHGSPPGVRSFVDHPPVNEVCAYDIVALGACGFGTPSAVDSGWTLPTSGGQGFSAFLYRIGFPPLTDHCAGGIPLPDGTLIWIYWDTDSDGPDLEDPLPPTDDGLPCPPNSVSFSAFAMNGEALGFGAGYFASENNFTSFDGLPDPPRYYTRICLPDRHWESPVFTLPAGPQEIDLSSMFCTELPCSTLSATPREPVVTEFRLDAVYPNPFNSSTTIRFALPHDERVLIRVFDITGKLTATLLNSPLSSGVHDVTWNASTTSSGLYFVSVTAGNLHQTQKLVLLK